MAEESDRRYGKRKKKRSFYQQAKKRAKHGYNPKGSQVDADAYTYFLNAMGTYNSTKFESTEEQEIFANNVLDEVKGSEVEYSCNQFVSRAIETLLPWGSHEVLKRFFEAFEDHLRPLCSDPFASHVIEKLVVIATQRIQKEALPKSTVLIKRQSDENGSDIVRQQYEDWVVKVGRYTLNNLEDFIIDTYANHVVRTAVQCLGGVQALTRKKQPDELVALCVPPKFVEVLCNFTRRLLAWPNLRELPYQVLSAGLLQVLLPAVHVHDKILCRSLVKKLHKEAFNENTLYSEVACHVVESVLSVASSKRFAKINDSMFAGHLSAFLRLKVSNFCVQKLIIHCKEQEQFEKIFDEISDNLEDVLGCGFHLVIQNIAEACKRLNTRQTAFVVALMKTLHCHEPVERQSTFAKLLLAMKSYESLEQKGGTDQKVSLSGALIAQAILCFEKNSKLLKSLLAMPPTDLVTLFKDPCGSHVMDSFMTSSFVGKKSRHLMTKLLEGHYVDLVVDKHGSRAAEAVWSVAPVTTRGKILAELCQNASAVKATQHGSILANKWGLDLFQRRKEDWEKYMSKKDSTKKMFADIVGNAGND